MNFSIFIYDFGIYHNIFWQFAVMVVAMGHVPDPIFVLAMKDIVEQDALYVSYSNNVTQ